MPPANQPNQQIPQVARPNPEALAPEQQVQAQSNTPEAQIVPGAQTEVQQPSVAPEVQPREMQKPEGQTAVAEQPLNVIPFPQGKVQAESVAPNVEKVEEQIEKNAGPIIAVDEKILLHAEHADPANLVDELERRRSEVLARSGYGVEERAEVKKAA